MAWQNPDPEDLGDRLRKVKTIAVVGLSDDPARDSDAVARYLRDQGYAIVPVNPRLDTWRGTPAHPDLAHAKRAVEAEGGKIDLVDVFRARQHVAGIVDEVLALDLPALWLQFDVIDEAAAERARAAGVWVVMDRCIKVDHGRYARSA